MSIKEYTIGFDPVTYTGDGTTTFDLSVSNKHFFTFGAQNETFTFSNPVKGANYIIVLKQDATGSRTITFPTVKWAGGTAPTLSTGANEIDIVSMFYDGTAYYATSSLNFS